MPGGFIYLILFFPAIILLGLITSFEDSKISKIKNKWVVLALAYTLMVYGLVWILFLLDKLNLINISRIANLLVLLNGFDKWCINLIISTFLSFLLWRFQIWAAGDAKLFICYAALIPIGQYKKLYFDSYFFSFYLMLVIFVPAALAILCRSAVFFISGLNFRIIKGSLAKLKPDFILRNLKEILKVALGYMIIFFLYKQYAPVFNGYLANDYFIIFVPIILFKYFSNLFKKNARILVVLSVLILCFILYDAFFLKTGVIRDMKDSILFGFTIIILVGIINVLISFYLERVQRKTISFAFWMFIGALIVWFF